MNSEIQINRYLSILLFLALLNLAYNIIFFINNSYLPAPFFYDKSDTFMDFYNPLLWANQDGIYTDWKSVYPPLNFIILRIYTFLLIDNIEDFKKAVDLRGIFGLNDLLLIFSYFTLIILSVTKSFSQVFSINKIIITCIIVLLSPVSLFSIERGNIIILSMYIFTLYVWCKSKFTKILLFSFLVNLKPYFAVIYIFELLRKKSMKEHKEFLILAPLISILIFLITGSLINQEYYLIFLNLFTFSSGDTFDPIHIFAFPSSIISYGYIPPGNITNFPEFLLQLPKIIIYGLIILSLIEFCKRKISNDYFLIFIVLFLTNYSITTGGYSALFYVPVMPILLINREYKILAVIVIAFFIGIWDVVNLFHLRTFDFNIYLSQNYEKVEVFFNLAYIVRPLANMAALFLFYKSLRSQNVV
jgi:hypothetical protein